MFSLEYLHIEAQYFFLNDSQVKVEFDSDMNDHN